MMQELLPYLSPAIALCALAVSLYAMRRQRFIGLENRIAEKAEGTTVAALAGKVDLLEDRATKIESALEHLPSKDATHKLQVSLTMLQGQVETLTEKIKPVTAMASRIQDVLIEQVQLTGKRS